MKYSSWFLILLCTAVCGVRGQFQLVLTFEGLEPQPIFVKVSNGANFKLVNRVMIQKNGSFTARIPTEFRGIVQLETGNGNSLQILSDNEDVIGVVGLDDQGMLALNTVTKGRAQQIADSYEEYSKKQELPENYFGYLKNLYTPNDPFYNALVEEEDRIKSLQKPKLNEIVWLDNYIQIKNKIQSASGFSKQDAINTLDKGGDFIENTGLLDDLIFLSLQDLSTAKTQEEFLSKFNQNVDNLLQKLNLTTERGQNTLELLLTMIPRFGLDEASQQQLKDKYIGKVNALDCKITESLNKQKRLYNEIKVGKVFPDIEFQKEWNSANTLHEVEAEKKVVFFWASWCPACMNEMPFVKEYYNTFKEEGGEFFAFSLDYEEDAYKQTTADLPWFNQTSLLKWNDPLVEQYGIQGTPTFFLLDKENKIVKIGNRLSEVIVE